MRRLASMAPKTIQRVSGEDKTNISSDKFQVNLGTAIAARLKSAIVFAGSNGWITRHMAYKLIQTMGLRHV